MPLTGHEIKCEGGKAMTFDCRNVDLVAFLPASTIGATQSQRTMDVDFFLSDIWGWTDPKTGREFVLLGRVDGTSFIDVTNPVRPKYLGDLPMSANARPSHMRTIKVYKNYAFIAADGAGIHSGVQVFDLTQLRSVKAAATPAVFRETARYDRINYVHNLIIDTAAGFAYTSGGGHDCTGMQIIDIRDPVRPLFAGCSTLGSHDAQCIVYHGPDQQYRGRQICIHANERSGIAIVDVTDKQQPRTISTASYPNVAYAHQGWLSEDQRYFYLGDELDEGEGRMTRTIVFDLSDLDDPIVAKEFFGTTAATDHNLYVRGDYVYQAHYRAGLRVLDVSDPVNPKEVGYFDTTPHLDNTPGFAGAWGNYPYFKSGVVAVSSVGEGLFMLRFKPPATVP